LSDDRAKDEGAHAFTVERMMQAPSDAIYRAWTEEFDTWFAAPGSIVMRASVGEPYWFEVIHEGARHPHYGRYLALRPGRLIEQTWVTGRNGTDGAETVVRLDLSEGDAGTRLRLTHRGFLDAGASARAAESWPRILAHLDDVLSSTA
jgi:uncharacterized protein YndB with AHSA1/START domain